MVSAFAPKSVSLDIQEVGSLLVANRAHVEVLFLQHFARHAMHVHIRQLGLAQQPDERVERRRAGVLG